MQRLPNFLLVESLDTNFVLAQVGFGFYMSADLLFYMNDTL
jgi:hypothetical protein